MKMSRSFIAEAEDDAEALRTVPLCAAEDIDLDALQQQYESAMHRRRTYCCDLASHVRNGHGQVFRLGRSYLVGYMWDGTFVLSHFAPASMREGVRILASRQWRMVAAVTDDLAGMLKRLGWETIGQVEQWFNGEVCMKQVFSIGLTATETDELRRCIAQLAS